MVNAPAVSAVAVATSYATDIKRDTVEKSNIIYIL